MKQRIENSTWKNILNDVKGQMTDVSFRTWFLPLTPIEMDPDAGTFIVASSDKMRINLLTLHYTAILEKSIENICVFQADG